MAHQAEEIHKQVRVYITVFAALAALTVITVGISYLHLSTPAAVGFAMIVAVIKGSLVALYFMHLIQEERAIYWLLGMTVVFFIAVMYLPASWLENDMRTHEVWDTLPHPSHSQHAGAEHGQARENHAEAARH